MGPFVSVVIFRRLNSITRRDRCPSVLIQDMFDQLQGSTTFTTLDFQSRYWQIPVVEDERPKLSFVSHRGQFSFSRVPFGITNGSQTFQRTVDEILHGFALALVALCTCMTL